MPARAAWSQSAKSGVPRRETCAAGFQKSGGLHTLRSEGADKPGEGVRILTALADAGLNLRGLSAAAIGKQFVCHIALDTEADAVKAARVLGEL